MLRQTALIFLVFLWACDDGGAEAGGDCRQASFACAEGFVCVAQVGAAWVCEPGRGPADGAVAPDARVIDGRVPDARVPDAEVDAEPIEDAARPDAAVPQAEPAGPCSAELPCLLGTCREDLPGGFCRVDCDTDEDCGSSAVCNAAGLCRTRCGDLPCRPGWACDPGGDEPTCVTHCAEAGCGQPLVCDLASGLCVPPPPCVEETCNDKDDDCDGQVDEGVQNACGVCGPLPAEVCNRADDDCDGQVDEGTLNACGACGPVPEERCNGDDDDCDGLTDEGVLNACGQCGAVPAEVCDGVDSDCDGQVDEAVVCAGGLTCIQGACVRPPSEPGGPCQAAGDCRVGECLVDPTLPGGLCAVDCGRDADCGAAAHCTPVEGGNLCLEACGGGCRPGWVCYVDEDICFPRCDVIGCADGYACGANGLCVVPTVTITLGQVFIRPGLVDGSNWDGFGGAPQGAIASVAAALGAPNVLAALAGAFGDAALGAYDPPDPFGSASLDGQRLQLPAIQDTYTPSWGGITWRNIALDPGRDIRLSVTLTDEDLANDDPIGTVELSTQDLVDALVAGRQIAVVTADQGVGYIVAVAVSVQLQ